MVRQSSGLPTFLGHPGKLLPPLFVISTCIKVLLIPAYRSTDFDVHRNWLSITRNLPLSEWYFDDGNGTTVHTLDYPPGFAYFEAFLSNNPIANAIAAQSDDRCFASLPDYDNDVVSDTCVAYQRGTVILSDLILWGGAYLACRSVDPVTRPSGFVVSSFLLIVFHPGLIWLDHVHFQYNGLLLGILLTSLGCLMTANNRQAAISNANAENATTTADLWLSYHLYTLLGAALFALLLNLKHLYLPLAPLYAFYLLGGYCRSPDRRCFLVKRFLLLAVVTGTTLVLPWVPFFVVTHDDDIEGDVENDSTSRGPSQQMTQIISRMFPFERGLLHDYWAANVWALYAFADRVLRFVVKKVALPLLPEASSSATIVAALLGGGSDNDGGGTTADRRQQQQQQLFLLPEPTPAVCGVLLLLAIIPGVRAAASAAASASATSSRHANTRLIEAVVYVSLCSFMLSYHVHEKAIMTILIPLAVLVERSPRAGRTNLLFWHATVWGLLGLFPLLFRPTELLLKVCTYVLYLALASFLLGTPPPTTTTTTTTTTTMGVAAAVVVLLDVVPTWVGYEFLPLMVTSVTCALGLVGCWATSLWLLLTPRGEEKTRAAGTPTAAASASAGSASASW